MKAKTWKLFGFVFAVVFVLSSICVVHAGTLGIIANIPVGNDVQGLAYDSGKGEVFAMNSGDGTVSVVSDATNTVVATIPVTSPWLGPESAAYDSAMGEVFVANHYSNSVSVISDTTNTVVATVGGVAGPGGAVYDSAMGEVFVGGTNANTVTVISDGFTPFVLPEYYFGALSALIACCAALIAYSRRRSFPLLKHGKPTA